MIRDIVKYGDPMLRTKGKRLEAFDDEIRALAADMLETMYAAPGIGLAANQVLTVGQPSQDPRPRRCR